MNLLLLLATVCLIPIIYKTVAESRCEFYVPGLFSLFSIGVYASMYAPWIFSRGIEAPSPYGGDSGYVTNVFWMTFVVLWFLNVVYWIGWISKKISLKDQEPETVIKRNCSFYGTIVLLALFWSMRLGHVMEYTSPRLLWHLVNGNAKAYYIGMEEREKLLLSNPDELLVVPDIAMPISSGGGGDITGDENNWVNEGVAAFYGLKYGVRIGE